MKRLVKWTVVLAVGATPFLAGIAHAGPGENVLRTGEKLPVTKYLQSASGEYRLYLHVDGTLELDWNGQLVWFIPSNSQYAHEFASAWIEVDGNFCFGDKIGDYPPQNIVWQMNTHAYTPPGAYVAIPYTAFVILQDDGKVVILAYVLADFGAGWVPFPEVLAVF